MNTEQPCVYAIMNESNGKRYIGSAVQFSSRRSIHKKLLRENRHHSPHLQAAWNLYGEREFMFIVIEHCTKQDTLEREQHWIDFYQSANPDHGYNLNPCAASWLGMKHSKETKAKLSKLKMGWQMPEEHRKKLIEANSQPHPRWRRQQKIGEKNPNAKLTADDVRRVKCLLATGGKVARLAEEYGVTYNCIWEIKKGKRWAHITEVP